MYNIYTYGKSNLNYEYKTIQAYIDQYGDSWYLIGKFRIYNLYMFLLTNYEKWFYLGLLLMVLIWNVYKSVDLFLRWYRGVGLWGRSSYGVNYERKDDDKEKKIAFVHT